MLYFVLKDFIQFPWLGYLLNSIYYGLIACGVTLSFFLANKRLRSFHANGPRVRCFMILALTLSIPAGYIGSRSANMFYHDPHLWSVQFFVQQYQAGSHHTFHGSLILPLIIISSLTLIMGLDFFKTMDTFFLYIPLGHAFGRTGCLMVGCCWGQEISVHLCGMNVTFVNPVPLYSILLNIALFLSLRKYFNVIYPSESKQNRNGSVAAFYLIIYGTVRYILELVRNENKIIDGHTQAQIVMLGFISLGCLILLSLFIKARFTAKG